MVLMEFILLIIILIQFGYIIYKDILFRDEREKLQLKLMSKDLTEYTSVVEEPKKPKAPVKKPDEYIDIEDVSVDRIIKAKEKL